MIQITLKPLISTQPARECVVEKRNFVIGRGKDCDYRIQNPLVSRHHCVLETRKGQLFVRDLESRNGTAVNGEMIVGPYPLKDGDRLWLGTSPLEIHIRELSKIGSGINLISKAVVRALGLAGGGSWAHSQPAA